MKGALILWSIAMGAAFAGDGDAEARQKVAEFQAAVRKSRDADELEAALRTLGTLQHPRVLKELLPYLKHPADNVRLAAAKEAARYSENREAALALADALQSLISNRSEIDLIEAFFDAFGKVGCKPVVGRIHPHLEHKDTRIARAAIQACGKVRSYRSVEPLLNVMRHLEAIQNPNTARHLPGGQVPGVPNLPGGGSSAQWQAQWDLWNRRQELLPAVHAALKAITGESHATSREWQAWWDRSGSELKNRELREAR